MESVVYASTPLDDFMKEQGIEHESIVEDTNVNTEESSDIISLPGSWEISSFNIQFLFVSSHLLSNDPVNIPYPENYLRWHYIQLFIITFTLATDRILTLIVILVVSSIGTLVKSSKKAESLSYLAIIHDLFVDNDKINYTILSQVGMYMSMSDTLGKLSEDQELTALKAMYARHEDGKDRRSHTSQVFPGNERKLDLEIELETPRTSPTITYIQSPVNKAFNIGRDDTNRRASRQRAKSHAHPPPLRPPQSVRQRAVSQQHLRVDSERNPPLLMSNSFGTPIGHISPAPSRKSSLVDKQQFVKPIEEPFEEHSSPEQTVKPSDITPTKPQPVLSKTRLWELRQNLHQERKELVCAIIALQYTKIADDYWRKVRDLTRDFATNLRNLNGRMQEGLDILDEPREVDTDDKKGKLTLDTLRNLEKAHDVLFECYTRRQYEGYYAAHTHLSQALKSYAKGIDEGVSRASRASKKPNRGGLELHLRNTHEEEDIVDKSHTDKEHFGDEGTNDQDDDVTEYLLNQTNAGSLPKRGGDEVVFDGENVENLAIIDETVDDNFLPPDQPDRASKRAGKEVLDELMGILGVERKKPASETVYNEQLNHEETQDNDNTNDDDNNIEEPPANPNAAREAAQRAVTSFVF
ncbi:hypothetical protein E3Q05_03602 [Wallemia mellicola]|nr:hypothetical protein E3Q05_03602 [Wallemia mellicola]